MLFKPNFCCNCGVKIERAEWGVLTSRRFCEVCAVEHKGHDWLPRAIVVVGGLMAVFGLGSYMGSQGQYQTGQLKAVREEPVRKIAVGAKQQPGIKPEEQISPAALENPGTAAIGLPPGPLGADVTKEQPRNSSAASDPPVHFCGAMTKKGKPCSRRVRSKGRCWQHVGQPSALVSQSEPDVY